ncbi:MAG: bifunctional folylpolyglutamate synthase/dihydrofolate synthase [Bacteroidetes bacterium]|nr:bifunctional folylpolyglutamate synthase/dihydrofolate synthase [Bacteroidota bacterium]
MNYSQAINILYDQLPMYQRVGKVAYKKDLTNTLRICQHLGNPQNKFKSILIGGTNGKGSSAHSLAAILQSAGYKTGLYTSPHLKDFSERIKVNGKAIEEMEVVDFVKTIQPFIGDIEPSFFEITVAMAFQHFAHQQVDWAIVEVGLGGRLDSTNVLTPQISLITNIGLDHQDMLGDTLEQIAIEKAGIIKDQGQVVISEYQPSVAAIFEKKAKDCHASLHFASKTFTVKQNIFGDLEYTVDILKNGSAYMDQLHLDLTGDYHLKNLPGILNTVDLLRNNSVEIKDDHIRQGLSRVNPLTGLKGRWQIINVNPLTICDSAHNIDGLKCVFKQIAGIAHDQLYIIMGMVKDKDPKGILEVFPKEAHYYFCQAKIPRALDGKLLEEQASQMGLKGKVEPDVNEALKQVMRVAGKRDIIFIGGSIFVLAELKEL